MAGADLSSAGKDWERVLGPNGPLCAPLPVSLALAPRMYRVYGKKNIKLEPVPLKGASLDPR